MYAPTPLQYRAFVRLELYILKARVRVRVIFRVIIRIIVVKWSVCVCACVQWIINFSTLLHISFLAKINNNDFNHKRSYFDAIFMACDGETHSPEILNNFFFWDIQTASWCVEWFLLYRSICVNWPNCVVKLVNCIKKLKFVRQEFISKYKVKACADSN